MLKAYATGGRGVAGNSQNRRGSGNNFTRPTSEQRRGPETMGDYLSRTGQTALGGNARTRGRLAPVRAVTRGR